MFSRLSSMFNNNNGRGNNGGGGRRPEGDGGGGGGGFSSSSSGSGGGGDSSSANHPSTSKRSRQDPATDETNCQAVQLDNSTAVIAKIAALYAERLMSDITLVVNGVEYPSHRLILCASSDVFQVMLMNPNWTEAQESRVVLKESAECTDVFEDFLKYLYTGRLKLEIHCVLHVLILADKYNIKDLIALCLSYMEMHIPAAAHHSRLILWLQYTYCIFGKDHAKIAQCCRNYLKWNLKETAKAEDFPHLDLEILRSILTEDDIVVEDENMLYEIVEYWILFRLEKGPNGQITLPQQNDVEFWELVYSTMDHIRFPMMTPRQIADLIQSPLIRQCKDLMDKMAIAMQFHNGFLEPTGPFSPNTYTCKLFTPRLYYTAKWSVTMQTLFHRMQHYQAHTLLFTTPCSFSDSISKNQKQLEWCLDFYPKAVHFQKFQMIGWRATQEMPEEIIKTVRLAVASRSADGNAARVRVQIGVVLCGYQDGIEHCRKVVIKRFIFNGNDKVLNLDDLLPYGDLTACAECTTRQKHLGLRSSLQHHAPRHQSEDFLHSSLSHQTFQSFHCSSGGIGSSQPSDSSSHNCLSADGSKACFLTGEDRNSIKLQIIITPFLPYNNCV